jgi:hypothetical protein
MHPGTIRLSIALLAAAFFACPACSKKSEPKEESAEQAAPVEETPSIVVAMTQAHGGMVDWRTTRSISFSAGMTSPGFDSVVVFRTMIDPKQGRMYVDVPGTSERMGCDGARVWSRHWSQPYPPRLLAELDSYLLSLPWLAMDPGAKLAVADADTLWGDPRRYSVVKMTPAPRGGVKPGSYRLYIDPESKELHACRFTSEGEFVVVYEAYATTGGMRLPTELTVYAGDYTPVIVATLGDWTLDQPFQAESAAMPDSAIVH